MFYVGGVQEYKLHPLPTCTICKVSVVIDCCGSNFSFNLRRQWNMYVTYSYAIVTLAASGLSSVRPASRENIVECAGLHKL